MNQWDKGRIWMDGASQRGKMLRTNVFIFRIEKILFSYFSSFTNFTLLLKYISSYKLSKVSLSGVILFL
jgi:hypothetical protein